MSLLSPRLQLKVAQKQILTPGLVQMVTVLQLNRLELKEMITQEIVKNPVLEESTEEPGEEITPEELLPLLEAEPVVDAADKQLLDMSVLNGRQLARRVGRRRRDQRHAVSRRRGDRPRRSPSRISRRRSIRWLRKRRPPPIRSTKSISARSSTIIWIPGYKSPASESVEKPSFETFLSRAGDAGRSSALAVERQPHLGRDPRRGRIDHRQPGRGRLSLGVARRDRLGRASTSRSTWKQALRVVQSLDPAGVGARNLRECLLLQIESINGKGGVAWQIVSNHLRLLETRQFKEIAKVLGRPMEHIEIAVNMIQHLNPRPGLRYSGAGARVVEPDVYFIKDGDDYIIQMNDEDVPQLRLNAQYRRMLDRDNGATKEVRDYVRERYTSAIQLMKNIEQRKQTILKVCQAIVRRQIEFLAHGLD